MTLSYYKKAVIGLILANIIWGMGPPIFKWSFQDVPPLTVAFFRFLIPVILLLPFIKHIQPIRIRDGFYVVLLGLMNISLNIGLYFIGLQYTASINQPVIASSEPILILLGSAIFLHDRANKRTLFGNLVGLTGILFIVLQPVLMATNIYSSFLGNCLFIGSTISAAIGTIVAKKLTKRYSAITLLFWTFLIATISFLPVPFEEISHHTFLINLTWQGLTGILFGGLISSFLGYGLFYYGLHAIKTSEITIFQYVDPVVAMLIAAPLLHEYPSPLFLLGTFLVFFGIFVAEGRIHWHPLHLLLK